MKIKTIGIGIIVAFVSAILLYSIYLHYSSTKKEVVSSPIAIPLEEIVGQRFIWGITGTTLSSESAALITTTHAGGVILMGELSSGEISSITAQIQSLPHTLPFIIAIDQEGGAVKRMMDDENPGGNQLGQMDNETFCSTISQTSNKLAQAGINTNFGIIGDIGWNKASYITPRTYGSTLTSVINKTILAIECSNPILTTIKHFPGHGRTLLNSHLTIPHMQTTYTDWLATDAQPFFQAIKRGVHIVMIGHLQYDLIASQPATLTHVYPTMLKQQGFAGLIITDDMGMLESSNINATEAMKSALSAGNDMLIYVTSKENPYILFQEALQYATSSSELNIQMQDVYEHIEKFKQVHLPN